MLQHWNKAHINCFFSDTFILKNNLELSKKPFCWGIWEKLRVKTIGMQKKKKKKKKKKEKGKFYGTKQLLGCNVCWIRRIKRVINQFKPQSCTTDTATTEFSWWSSTNFVGVLVCCTWFSLLLQGLVTIYWCHEKRTLKSLNAV